MNRLFDLAFDVTAPFWALMILAPTWSWTKRIISSPWIVLPPLTVWAVVAVPRMAPLWSLVTGPSLAELTEVTSDPGALTYLWAQIAAWDLFVARWVYLDSRARNVQPLLAAPIFVLMVLLPPIGLVVYLILRPLLTRAPESSLSIAGG